MDSGKVKFISYDGKWPCLCMGTLVLEIDNKQYRFGYGEPYTQFWASGGSCGFTPDYSDSVVESGDWEIYKEDLPEELQSLSQEISEVINSNIPHGCCGGCL